MRPDPIADLVHRYADAVVCGDATQWANTWADDGVWDLGQHGPTHGRVAILEVWRAAMDAFESVVQTVLNGTYEVDEDAGTGSGRWYVQEHWRRVDESVGFMLARYDDTYVRIDGEWRFASRVLVILYVGAPDLSGTFLKPRN